jgi:DNA-binding MarR family transcriptional regulator
MKELLQYRKTYKAGLLQAKAFRILKYRTNEVLKPYGINATDWGVLGLLIDEKKGVQLRVIAQEVGVKQPYITRSIATLSKQGYVTVAKSEIDSRAQNAFITAKGKSFVEATEKIVLKQLKETFGDISARSLLGYVQTLDSIVSSNANDMYRKIDLDHMIE